MSTLLTQSIGAGKSTPTFPHRRYKLPRYHHINSSTRPLRRGDFFEMQAPLLLTDCPLEGLGTELLRFWLPG
ncbi:MAG: hypothetical protein ACK4LB_05150 [Spirosomataceae bacterium]